MTDFNKLNKNKLGIVFYKQFFVNIFVKHKNDVIYEWFS